MPKQVRVAIIDNSINPALYNPVGHWSRYVDAPWQAFRPKDGFLPDPNEEFTHILLTGSEASIIEAEDWVGAEAGFIREAVARGLAVLGSCYGHQLLALALAGPEHIRRRLYPEVGWVPIQVPRPCRLLGGAGSFYVFSVHFDEVIGLPDPFEVLASTETCPIQAFALKGRPVWGVQPHPEIDGPAARRLLRDYSGLFPDVRPLYEKALASPYRDSGLIYGIVRAFLEAIPEDFSQ
jgi:GMP synthase-like glutamine amidotransferase